MLRNKNNRKTLQIFIGMGIVIFAFLDLAYIYRLRKALSSSTESYKATIVEIDEKVARLEAKNIELKNEILIQGMELTNSVSANYELESEPLNISLNDVLIADEESGSTRIIVAGHLYGAHSEDALIIPAKTLSDSVPEINKLSPDLFIALGDLAQYPSNESFQKLHQNFLDKVNAPVLNTPGNHDFDNGRAFYEDEFGQTFYFIKYAQNQIVILDTEIANCFIVGSQREMLEKAIDSALRNDDIQNIFVFFHRVLFFDESLQLREKPNGVCKYGNNYTDLQDEIFIPAAQAKPVYLIAGDVGAFDGNLSPFYNNYPDIDLYTLAVGLGDSQSDVLLQIDIHLNEVDFELIPIGGNAFYPIESYTPEYWAAQ